MRSIVLAGLSFAFGCLFWHAMLTLMPSKTSDCIIPSSEFLNPASSKSNFPHPSTGAAQAAAPNNNSPSNKSRPPASQSPCLFQKAGIFPNEAPLAKASSQTAPHKVDFASWKRGVATDPDHWTHFPGYGTNHPEEIAVPPFHMNTHSTTDDKWISGFVHEGRIWDRYIWRAILTSLNESRAYHERLHGSLEKPLLFVDVGGNIGFFSLMAASAGHRVITFEPMGYNLQRLVPSIRKNGFENRMTLYNNAVSDDYAIVNMKPTSTDNSGNFQIGVVKSVAKEKGIYGEDYAETVRLDDIIHEDVNVMKLDVEGFESRGINGALNVLCNYIVEYIIMEIIPMVQMPEGQFAEMVHFLRAIGYEMHDIHESAPHFSAKEVDVTQINQYLSHSTDVIFRKVDRSRAPIKGSPVPAPCLPLVKCSSSS